MEDPFQQAREEALIRLAMAQDEARRARELGCSVAEGEYAAHLVRVAMRQAEERACRRAAAAANEAVAAKEAAGAELGKRGLRVVSRRPAGGRS